MVDAVRDAVRSLTRSAAATAAGAGGRKALKRRDVDKLKAFGFDKVAAVLCYSDKLARYLLEFSPRRIVKEWSDLIVLLCPL